MKKYLLVIYALSAFFLFGCSISENSTKTVEPIEQTSVQIKSTEEKLLDSMSTEEKAGQLIIVGYQKGIRDEEIKAYIDEYKVGGFILFKRNYSSFEELYKLTDKLKKWNSSNKVPLFIAVDEEGGSVSRLPAGGTRFPDARLIGNIMDEKLTYKVGETIGRELYAAGVNINFAPVLDILSNKNNTFLYKRTFGSSADTVSINGSAFIRGLQSQSIIAAPKHFPGHGDTAVDSHGKLPVINIDKALLSKRELIPFKKSIETGIDAIMIGHLAYPQIDRLGVPATKSKLFLTDILRKELGFKGIAITDEIEMYGFLGEEASLEDSIIQAFNAGVDVFVIGHTKKIQDRVIKAILAAVKDGTISEERLNESVMRILKVKNKYNLKSENPLSFEEAQKQFGSEKNKAVYKEVINRIKSN